MRTKLCLIVTAIIFFLLPANTYAQAKNTTDTAINITLKGKEIYYNGNLIATYKNVFIDTDLLSIVVYNKTTSRVAEATHATGDENWTIVTPVDQNKMYLPWTDVHSLELLFRFLVEKKYL